MPRAPQPSMCRRKACTKSLHKIKFRGSTSPRGRTSIDSKPMTDFNQDKNNFTATARSPKKIFIWAVFVIIIIVIVIVGIVLYMNKSSQPAAPSSSQAAVGEQLQALNVMRSQFTPASAATSVVAAAATVNQQIKTLDSLKQKTNPAPISPTQVQSQLDALNALRSKQL